tara:strand:+ start:5090 stop:5461 length:372 start_codon:yes stop_codon:yes gene_type:complete
MLPGISTIFNKLFPKLSWALIYRFMDVSHTMEKDSNEEAVAFLHKSTRAETDSAFGNDDGQRTWARSWLSLRLLVEVVMASAIVYLLAFRATPTRHLRRTPVPDCKLIAAYLIEKACYHGSKC